MRGETDEPGIGVIVRRSGFAGCLGLEAVPLAQPQVAGAARFVHDRLHHARHQDGHGRPQHLLARRGGLEDQVAVGIFDAVDRGGPHADALVGEDAVGGHQINERHLTGADADGVERPDLGGDAHVPGVIPDAQGRDLHRQLDGDQVARLLEPLPQRHQPLELAVVVLGIPDRSVEILDRDGVVLVLVDREQVVVQRRRVHERLERRAGLALGLGGAVELARLEVAAPDHGQQAAAAGIHGDESRLHDEGGVGYPCRGILGGHVFVHGGLHLADLDLEHALGDLLQA